MQCFYIRKGSLMAATLHILFRLGKAGLCIYQYSTLFQNTWNEEGPSFWKTPPTPLNVSAQLTLLSSMLLSPPSSFSSWFSSSSFEFLLFLSVNLKLHYMEVILLNFRNNDFYNFLQKILETLLTINFKPHQIWLNKFIYLGIL